MPCVSVIIPTYNNPDFLLETLETVFAQTYRDFEIVLINDGSTDDTLKRIAPLVEAHSDRFRVITQANAGIGAARNRGIAEALGKYVAPLDHDDLWMPTKLETQVRFLDEHPDVIAVGVPFSESDTPQTPIFNVQATVDPDGIVQHPLRKAAHGVYVILTSMLMFRREAARGLEYGARRGAIEDVPFQVGLLARGKYAIAGSEILAIYRLHPANFSKTADYYYQGVLQLRQMDQSGRFDEIKGLAREDMLYYVAHLGRITAFRQLDLGRRRQAVRIYLGEFRYQLRQGRFAFLAAFPLMMLLPRTVRESILRWQTRRERHGSSSARRPGEASCDSMG